MDARLPSKFPARIQATCKVKRAATVFNVSRTTNDVDVSTHRQSPYQSYPKARVPQGTLQRAGQRLNLFWNGIPGRVQAANIATGI